jgi:phage-related baseplate assembly protein
MLNIYKITMDCVGHGDYPTRLVAAPDVETAIAAARQSLNQYATDEKGKPVRVIGLDTVGHVDIVANAKVEARN